MNKMDNKFQMNVFFSRILKTMTFIIIFGKIFKKGEIEGMVELEYKILKRCGVWMFLWSNE
jgi:hypothetical protein